MLGRDIGGLVVSFWPKFILKNALEEWQKEFKKYFPDDEDNNV